MKLVSVIVLSYCSEDTIIQTLDSIKNQTYQQIELIITDDCSRDNTVGVVQDWIASNQGELVDIKLVTTDHNTGIPGNVNRALAQANGAYIKIIAADDYMADHAIERYVQFCEDNPGKIPIAKVRLFADAEADFTSVQQYCDRCYEFAKKEYREQYRRLLIQNWIVAPSASFYPMEAVKKAGGYDEHYKWFEDYPMNLKIMHQGYGCGLIDEELVYYRMSDKSVTATQRLRLQKTEMKLFFREKMWYMIQFGMGWEAVKQSKSWIKVLFKRGS